MYQYQILMSHTKKLCEDKWHKRVGLLDCMVFRSKYGSPLRDPGMSNEYSMNEGAGRVGEEEEAVIAL